MDICICVNKDCKNKKKCWRHEVNIPRDRWNPYGQSCSDFGNWEHCERWKER